MKRALAAALLLAACSPRAKEGTVADTTADSAHPRTAGDAIVSAKSLQELDDKYVHDWERPSCEMDTTVAHPAARALLDEYLQRDTTWGFFAGGPDSNDTWLNGIVECPGHSGGVDEARVVAGYSVDSLPAGPDSARYVVRWRTLGASRPEIDHMRFDAEPSTDVDTIALVRTPYGWRIIGDADGVDFGVGAVRRTNLDPESRVRLDESVHRSAQELLLKH
jgi:hypothetical protein